MQTLVIIADTFEQSSSEAGCYKASLQAQDCHPNCNNCYLNDLMGKIDDCFHKMHYNQGK